MKKITSLLISLCIILSIVSVPVFAQETSLYIVAEDFEKCLGSWLYTEPDGDKAGAGVLPYLKSPKPAEAKSAFVSFDLPDSGEYFVFAFTRDYTSAQGTRRFLISVNGNELARKFGTHGADGWAWEPGGSVELEKGACTIEVIDSTRNYGRVMAIVLTKNADFKGPETKEDLEAAFKKNHAVILDEIIIPEPKPEEPIDTTPTYIPENIPVQDNRPSDDISVQLNGKYLVFQDDSKPFVENGRTLVPFRALFEALGCTVSWDGVMQTASGKRGTTHISLPVGNQLAEVSNENVYLDQPAVLSNSRVMVPIRFVAESLGAEVSWDAETRTVIIFADIPKITTADSFLFLPQSFSTLGTWTVSDSGGGSFDTGMLTGGSGNAPENTIPAKAYFDVLNNGTYRVWVHSKDYATNQPGTRFFNVAVNDSMLAPTFGTHGKEGFFWTDGGTVELSEGTNVLELLDTADFFGRCDAIIITENLSEKEPSSDLKVLQKNSVAVEKMVLENSVKFPEYANEQSEPISVATIENEYLKVDFYTVNTSKGAVIQNSISYKKDGNLIVTKDRTEDFGFILLSADKAEMERPLLGKEIFNTAYTDFYGNAKQYYGSNIYRAANVNYLIPNAVSVSDNKAYLSFESSIADFSVVWSLEQNTSKIEATSTFKETGCYSIGVYEGSEMPASKVTNSAEITADPGLITLSNEGSYTTQSNIKKGVKTTDTAGISLRGPTGNFRATAFSPVLGTKDSYKNIGETQNFTCYILSSVQ